MRIPFNILDEAFVHTWDPRQPLTVQMEARVAGRLDEERARKALVAAAAVHPLARARVLPWSDGDPHPEWEIDDEPMLDPLRVVEIADPAELDAIRSALLSIPIGLFESPPWRARLVHAPGGDVIMLSVHHAASDGVGCLRLLQSVLRAYVDLPDPVPDLDPAESHALSFAGKPTLLEQARGAMLEFRKFGHLASPAARVAPDGAHDSPGYGIVTRRVPSSVAVESSFRRQVGASVNDLLLAVLHLTIGRWNETHGRETARIAVFMPINARPAPWKSEVVGNLVVGEAVSTTPDERRSPEACLRAIAGWTESIKARGPGTSVSFLAGLPSSSIRAKRQAIVVALNAVGDRLADTSVLSNVGRVAPDWINSDEISIEEVSFSPPTTMPGGIGLGAAATDQWLSLSFRHRPALLDASAAVAFADLYVRTLEETASA